MKTKKQQRVSRRRRIRSKVSGTAIRPRLSIFRSNTRLYAQCIDDQKMVTISSGFVAPAVVAKAKELGAKISEELKKKGIETVVFDRGGFRYHGVVKAFADAVREGGITI